MQLTSSRQDHFVRRSLLTVPAINGRALEKAVTLSCDGIIFDLEDSVAPEMKAEARDKLRNFMKNSPLGLREGIIRINGVDTPFLDADLDLVASVRPDAVLIPKVETPEDLILIAERLKAKDATQGLSLWAMIETPKGVLNAGAIAALGRNGGGLLDCFVVGLNDLRKATGIPREPNRTYLVPFLMQILLAARAHGLSAIDSVSNDFRDIEAFGPECAQGRAMGYDGKMLIHPAQIEPANQHFGPSDGEIAEARAIIEAFSTPEAANLNVINLDGKMVERLHLEDAERLMAQIQIIERRKTIA
ncbi:CoA ester lyase [Peteryoungia desertarenae]|uniref:CoA ester lyase n=1 Tax=Peteryoungia desertarenae TaxID=1813451 RepID=A0ABX6QJN6_9HYPH|nr:CoA ester lyase [Peteryoungia desertarenae]QLF68766.1 CoA ester lyase [Peteryoungia desertarenae]